MEGFMGLTESKYERLDELERQLVRHPEGCTTGELAQMLAVDASTIHRYLRFLEDRGTGLIKEGRRYRIDHRRALHTVKMTNDELLALFLAARLLSRHSDEHNPHVVKALEKLADALRIKSPLIARHIDMAAGAVRVRRVHPAYVEALQVLAQGWAEERKIWMRYRSFQNRVSERTLSPYFIEPSGIGYACHVIGWDDESDQLRTFKIERISEARLTNERFAIPPEFNPQKLLADAWGVIWRDEGSIEVVLRFSAAVARRVSESVWHHSQQIEDLPDGSCRFTVRVGSTLEMRPWIRQWGADVEVLSPAELRADLVNEVQRMTALYGLGVN
jgi:proteasome accessory factor B